MKRTYAGRGAWLTLSVCLMALAASCGCGKPETPPAANAGGQAQQPPQAVPEQPQPAAAAAEQPTPAQPARGTELLARMETSMGTIVLRLAEGKAPNTVANFVHLVSKGFYDGIIFHRVISGFMIQAGCPEGTGFGGPGWRIADEFHPDLRHSRGGVLSMAKSQPNTGGSQFFITLAAKPHLDDVHAVFGEVVDGMDVVNAIGALPTGPQDRPLDPPQIKRIVLLRDGVELTGAQPAPQTVPDWRRRRQ